MAQEPDQERVDKERVVGVYPDEQAAEEAAEAARAAGARDVQVGGRDDEVAALRAEMREEGAEAWAGPSVGIYTPEMARSVPVWTAVAALVGAVVALPLGFIEAGDVSLTTRLVVAAFAGAVTGGTIGFIVGGGFFEPRRKAESDLAAERGVVVGAEEDTGTVAPAVDTGDSIRVDRVTQEGQPETTLDTERRQAKSQRR